MKQTMKQIDRITLENVLYERAYNNARILDESEWFQRFEEGKYLLIKFIEKLEELEKLNGR